MPLTSLSSERHHRLLAPSLAWFERAEGAGWTALPGITCWGINRNSTPKGHARSGSPDLALAGPENASALWEGSIETTQQTSSQALPRLQNKTAASCTTPMKYPQSSDGLGDSRKPLTLRNARRFLLLNDLLAQLQSCTVLYKLT